jgi:hypothetical protein
MPTMMRWLKARTIAMAKRGLGDRRQNPIVCPTFAADFPHPWPLRFTSVSAYGTATSPRGVNRLPIQGFFPLLQSRS